MNNPPAMGCPTTLAGYCVWQYDAMTGTWFLPEWAKGRDRVGYEDIPADIRSQLERRGRFCAHEYDVAYCASQNMPMR